MKYIWPELLFKQLTPAPAPAIFEFHIELRLSLQPIACYVE